MLLTKARHPTAVTAVLTAWGGAGSGLMRGGAGGGAGSELVGIMHSAWPSPVLGQGASGFPHRAVGAGADGRALVTGAEGCPVHTAFSPAGVLWISVSPESALGHAGLFRCGFLALYSAPSGITTAL